jgi:hypothetical protein
MQKRRGGIEWSNLSFCFLKNLIFFVEKNIEEKTKTSLGEENIEEKDRVFKTAGSDPYHPNLKFFLAIAVLGS